MEKMLKAEVSPENLSKSPKAKEDTKIAGKSEMTYEMLRDFIIDSKITSDTSSEPMDPMEDPKMK